MVVGGGNVAFKICLSAVGGVHVDPENYRIMQVGDLYCGGRVQRDPKTGWLGTSLFFRTITPQDVANWFVDVSLKMDAGALA
jgi:hypothetical protein